jgi:hypothetical protein
MNGMLYKKIIGLFVVGVFMVPTGGFADTSIVINASSKAQSGGNEAQSGEVYEGTSRASSNITIIENGEVVKQVSHSEESKEGESVTVHEHVEYIATSSEENVDITTHTTSSVGGAAQAMEQEKEDSRADVLVEETDVATKTVGQQSNDHQRSFVERSHVLSKIASFFEYVFTIFM